MKFFTRRQMRSIHKGQLQRQRRAASLTQDDSGPPVKISLIQQLCGNLDRMVVVAALQFPEFKPGLVDRLLVMAELDCLPAILVLTKADVCEEETAQRWQRLYAGLGYPTLITSVPQPLRACSRKSQTAGSPQARQQFSTSSHTGRGISQLRALLEEGRSAFCGHSGVGKSSLLAALEPKLAPEVGDVSAATQKGQHTTTRVRLYQMSGGGEIFDLPGLKLAPLACRDRDLARAFPEFAACRCRFRDCLHEQEPGCAVLEAVEQTAIERIRYESYRRILDSLR